MKDDDLGLCWFARIWEDTVLIGVRRGWGNTLPSALGGMGDASFAFQRA
jgi:hypothetical protein